MAWVAPEKDVTVSEQCALAGVSRATVYAQRKPQFVCVVALVHLEVNGESTPTQIGYAASRLQRTQ
jgi:hypothetical protein